jgi:ribosomal protein L37AE/L43A
MKPCRECSKIPENGYSPSRVLRSDWICQTCNNKKRSEWLKNKSNREPNYRCPFCRTKLESPTENKWKCPGCHIEIGNSIKKINNLIVNPQ